MAKKPLTEADVIVGAAYCVAGLGLDFVVLSKHSGWAYVKFGENHFGYVEYKDMEVAL